MIFRIVGCSLGVAIVSSGCDRKPGATGAAAAAKPGLLVVSGDTAGWITPCGCASNQSGGLLRRGTYLATLRTGGNDVVYVDCGGAAGGDSEYYKLKFESILAGERLMGIAAHNLGKSEIAFGAAFLRDVRARLNAPFMSANAHSRDGQPLAAAARIVVMGGRRIAIVGVVSPRYAAGDIVIDDPRSTILSTAGKLKDQFDSLVVLAYLPEDELQSLATALPEADAVIGGPTGQAIAPKQLGPTLLAAATNKGKFLVELQPAPAWSGRVVEMGPSIADHPEQVANVQTYLQRLAKRDFTPDETGLLGPGLADAPSDYRVAGTQSCATCHAVDQSIWERSKHARAWETLAGRKFEVDPYCLQCHTTGYGLPGGFVSPQRSPPPALTAVGCENCHGPSQAHVARPATAKTTFVAADQCIRCHDQENSPSFDRVAYWATIRHGKNMSPATAPGATTRAVASMTLSELAEAPR